MNRWVLHSSFRVFHPDAIHPSGGCRVQKLRNDHELSWWGRDHSQQQQQQQPTSTESQSTLIDKTDEIVRYPLVIVLLCRDQRARSIGVS